MATPGGAITSPQRERASKYFRITRQNASSSPPAFLPGRSPQRTTSTPLKAPAFTAASSLMRRASIQEYTAQAVSLVRNECQQARDDKIEAQRSRAAHTAGISTARSVTRTSPKSAQLVHDSDDSDAVLATRVRDVAHSVEISEPLDQPGFLRSNNAVSGNSQVATAVMTRAPVRRRSWTPLIDTIPVDSIGASPGDQPSFSEVVGSFQYGDVAPPVLPVVAEHPAKRRKVAVAKRVKAPKVAQIKPPKVPKEPKAKTASKPKQPRKPPKKPQTITALAMAPYRPPSDPANAQITIPEALAMQAPEVNESVAEPAPKKRKTKATAATTSKKPRKNAKKVKINVPEVDRELLTPTQAQGSLTHQTFIFGTSSQLHAEESSETLTQIQSALRQSELSPQSDSNYNSPKKSRVRVPTAPHGTSLSLGQAHRDLWCVSARDHAGGILVATKDSQHSRNDSVRDEPLFEQMQQHNARELQDQIFCTAPEVVNAEASKPVKLQVAGNDDSALSRPPANNNTDKLTSDDSFILLSSDSDIPIAEIMKRTHTAAPRACDCESSLPPWPSAQRPALRPLDANLNIGRVAASRDLKHLSQNGERRRSPRTLTKQRNENDAIEINTSSPLTPAKTTTPAKILAALPSSPPSEWHNVDEISDSEAPISPSPPRTRKKPVIRPILELLEEDGIIHDATTAVVAPTRLAKGNTDWTPILFKLFPQITSTVRTTPRSNSLTHPTWHEKILLYDPIVIEDLTAWLNEKGLRVTVPRKVASKKKKNSEPEYEDLEEELAHWMVQKWCEDNSICCLWKEGLRGGVRTRY